MIARISTARSLAGAIRYSEQKIREGVARFVLARDDIAFASVADKVAYLEQRARLNRRIKSPCLHIAIAFPAGEQADILRLAQVYMERIGFGGQPYLVYAHDDTPHPHLHVVTTPVDEAGHWMRPRQSKQVTVALEKEFGLIRVSKEHPALTYKAYEGHLLEQDPSPPIRYQVEAKTTAIERTLRKVLQQYRFTSLEEFNALLLPYHLQADRGQPGGRIYEHGGLVYRVLDEEGKQQGKYIKSSALPGKPTLAYLERRFEECRPLQAQAALPVRNAIDWSLLFEEDASLSGLREGLREAGILMVNTPGDGLVYIDHRHCWAFAAQALGENYTGPAIAQRCHAHEQDLALTLDKAYKEQMRALWPERIVGWGLSLQQSL